MNEGRSKKWVVWWIVGIGVFVLIVGGVAIPAYIMGPYQEERIFARPD